MQPIIKNGEIVEQKWQLLAKDVTLDELPANDAIIVPLALWREHSAELKARQGALGVWLDAGEEAEEIADQLQHFEVIALNFPAFTDGRNYSNAYLLRNRFGYRKELRAIGDVLRDQLFAMKRVGFDSFALRTDRDMADAVQSFGDFAEVYQASVDQPLPLFRRRA